MQKLKDINVMRLDEERINSIAATFQSGESTKQEAFDALVNYSIEVLEPFTEERKSGLKLVQGALKKLGKLMEGTILDTLGLTTTYCQPARQLARAHIEGCPTHLRYVLDNLTENGDSEAGDLPGPLFAPSRLIISMKALRLAEDKSPFEVDSSGDEDILMLADKEGTLHRFGSLSIEGIKDLLRTGKTEPGTLDLINSLIGEFTPEGKKPKPGTLGRAIAEVVKAANAGEEPDSFALDVAESLTTAMLDCREAAIRRNREERASREAQADMKRAQARLKAQQDLGLSRERVGASVADTTGDTAQEESDSDEE